MKSCIDPNTSKFLDTFIDTLTTIHPAPAVPVLIGTSSITTCPSSSYILFNTEQMTIVKNIGEIQKTIKTRPPVEIWDYSLVNISILESHGITNTRHVPLTTSPETVQKIRSFRTSPQYDIGFNGGLTERRMKILNGLRAAGISVHIVTSWGEERDRELAKCRFILNIHADDDYKVFESARCVPWLDSGIPVISETSVMDDPRCINSPYERLIDTCIDQLRNTSEGFSDYSKSYAYILGASLLFYCGLKFFTD